MKNSLMIVLFFLLGVGAGRMLPISGDPLVQRGTSGVLLLLIFLVGVGVGSNVKVWRILREMHMRILLVPLSVVAGTLVGAAAVSVVLRDMPVGHALAVGCGFGYYSLSSAIIAKREGDLLGTTALVSNLLREIATLLLAPVLAKYFGKLAPVASGGATAMDTTLPVITKSSGEEYAVVAVFSGMVLTVLVPVVVPLLLGLEWGIRR